MASRRLPEVVRRLSESEGADEVGEIDPIDITSTDEIGEVARAFDQVHREAVRLAAHQAMLRGNLNAMFINLSRRSQMLVERQLVIIESLEQSEQDPDRLSNLFRLDHLATRMRRNSENLLVLAGHEDPRKWSKPVPLVDVVRAAVSEIEQYERVVVNIQPGILITGRAASDVVHLAAELVENAAMFSSAQVAVTARLLTTGGVLIEVADAGLGIPDQELQQANWRLDNPLVIDVGVSRRMGLFVVGRLAARHGIRVRLRHGQPSGLSALVWLPDTVAELETAPRLTMRGRLDAGTYTYPAASRVSAAPASSAPVAPSLPLRTVGVPAPAVTVRSAEPDWFRRGDKPIGSAASVSPENSWASPADEGFRAARAAASPVSGGTSPAGLPKRVPNANLVPGSVGRPAGQQDGHQAGSRRQAAAARRRSPEEVRHRLTDFQRGARRGRSDAPWNFGGE